jgi:hypothetical protein
MSTETSGAAPGWYVHDGRQTWRDGSEWQPDFAEGNVNADLDLKHEKTDVAITTALPWMAPAITLAVLLSGVIVLIFTSVL